MRKRNKSEDERKRGKRHILKPKQERKKTPYKIDLTKLIIILAAVVILSAILWSPIESALSKTSPTKLRDDINAFGALAPIIYICIMIVQVLVSIVPGQFVTLFGGFTFGAFWGTVYSMIGMIIGSAIAFQIGKRFGRPFLEDIIDTKLLRRFDQKSAERGIVILFFFFLLPFTPDNAACFAAGLTKIRLRSLIWVAAIGRLPGTMVSCLIGSGFGRDASMKAWIFIGALTLLIFLAYWHKKRLEKHAYNFMKPKSSSKKSISENKKNEM
ncbi:TVP38/TMEM64 family protein [Candidatus Woesearchaeota archaeon]|nr:TVP38/TMEM64 family protein [Candidatus Woesearchaeota archaeon]